MPITRDRSNGLALRTDVLDALMVERGWNRARLSRETGIHQTHLTRILIGETPPTDDSVGKIMRAFPGHTIDHLFSRPAARPTDVTTSATGSAA